MLTIRSGIKGPETKNGIIDATTKFIFFVFELSRLIIYKNNIYNQHTVSRYNFLRLYKFLIIISNNIGNYYTKNSINLIFWCYFIQE